MRSQFLLVPLASNYLGLRAPLDPDQSGGAESGGDRVGKLPMQYGKYPTPTGSW